MTKIVICFFGITRSLRFTIGSIKRHLITPAKRLGDVTVCGHLFRQGAIHNPRSGEYGELDKNEYRLIPFDELEQDEPELFLPSSGFEELRTFGDGWTDNFRSLRNLVHQLHSLSRVGAMALGKGADLVIFCRPDLRYHDDFYQELRWILERRFEGASVPRWQPWSGLNDRFAVCSGAPATKAYAFRLERAAEYCRATGQPLMGENLLKYALWKDGISVRKSTLRASRVRFDGEEKVEDFSSELVFRCRQRVKWLMGRT